MYLCNARSPNVCLIPNTACDPSLCDVCTRFPTSVQIFYFQSLTKHFQQNVALLSHLVLVGDSVHTVFSFSLLIVAVLLCEMNVSCGGYSPAEKAQLETALGKNEGLNQTDLCFGFRYSKA